MALIICPDCRKEISDRAKACPNCGCPVAGGESATPEDMDNQAKCPNCGSSQISAQKEGFDTKTACCSAFLVGPFGILCGARKSNRLNGICLKCGHKWVIQRDIRTHDSESVSGLNKDIRTHDSESVSGLNIDGKRGGKNMIWAFAALFGFLILISLLQKCQT